ncbi:epoxyqueuosine reductase [Anoxynatronum buryatiense]|uniref:Epoxyqueuosine reductase n=1 Tax=Anoxynatronum buryatiense TaxID=489973 RepID=A0AA46AIP9_9CLOT|nr:epoxyqueuosine reductase [Anoxynatronum buryatiense]SMP51960.1 hypothetical protein SAMN06296020_104155 [Anoxynatronum buryatiense]
MELLIREWIQQYVADYPGQKALENCWQSPLTAFAPAEDPRFHHIKNWGQPKHQLPSDLLPEARTVVAYFLPFLPVIPHSNRNGRLASREWGRAYLLTNQLIADLNLFLKDQLEQAGFKAAFAQATHNFDETTLMSVWSHRHVAYLAGLGNFGLNNMLITEKGCCGRVGTLVTSALVTCQPMTPAETCLYRYNGSCGLCVQRCVNGSLTLDAFDRHRCYEMCLENASALSSMGLADVCGKCTVGLPCSGVNPTSRLTPSPAGSPDARNHKEGSLNEL